MIIVYLNALTFPQVHSCRAPRARPRTIILLAVDVAHYFQQVGEGLVMPTRRVGSHYSFSQPGDSNGRTLPGLRCANMRFKQHLELLDRGDFLQFACRHWLVSLKRIFLELACVLGGVTPPTATLVQDRKRKYTHM